MLFHQVAEGKTVSYAKEVFVHRNNLLGLLGATSVSAVMAILYGWGPAVVPLLLFVLAEVVAVSVLPPSASFRAKVQKKHHAAHRRRARDHLIAEIQLRVSAGDPHWSDYRRMVSRIDALKEVAWDRHTSLTDDDVERFADAILEFLKLWLSKLVMDERRAAIDDTRARLERLREPGTLGGQEAAEARKLKAAEGDLARMLALRERLETRIVTVEVALLSISESLEELYQSVTLNPRSDHVRRQLETALERVRMEEESLAELEAEMAGGGTGPEVPRRLLG